MYCAKLGHKMQGNKEDGVCSGKEMKTRSVLQYAPTDIGRCCTAVISLSLESSPSLSLSLTLSIASTKGRVSLLYSCLHQIYNKPCPKLFSTLHSVSATLCYSNTVHRRQAVLSTCFHFIFILVIYNTVIFLIIDIKPRPFISNHQADGDYIIKLLAPELFFLNFSTPCI